MALHSLQTTPVLFLDKVFLRRRKDQPLRGVELFNLQLIRDLAEMGVTLTVLAERSWRDAAESVLGGRTAECLWIRNSGRDVLGGFLAVPRLWGRRFDVLILGNVGNGILPALGLLRRLRVFTRCVLIANREASPRFVRFFRSLPGHVLAVNQVIAEPFRRAGCRSVHVDYGIVNAGQFTPRAGYKPADAPVDFCVLGLLDDAWKGADTAVAAFRRLPEPVRSRCRLHLLSFLDPPDLSEPGISVYRWMDAEDIPRRLREMDVLLVPSRDEEVMRETFSQAMVQGMLTGLPVIASDRPVLTEKLDAGGGLVFHDLDGLVVAMTALAEDAQRRRDLGAQARSTALTRYVWSSKNFVTRYLLETGDRERNEWST